jgi:hypothetical protein
MGRLLAAMMVAGCAGGPDCTLVPTPGGYVGRACIVEVPSGGSVESTDAGTIVRAPDGGVVEIVPPCPCPRPDGGVGP